MSTTKSTTTRTRVRSGVPRATRAANIGDTWSGERRFIPREERPAADIHPWGDLTTFRTIAEGLSDAIKARISTVNRVDRGGGAVDPMQAKAMKTAALGLEGAYRDLLIAAYEKQVPAEIRDFAAGIPGLATGELFPRILGVLGHPRIAIPYRWEDGATEPVPDGDPYFRTLRELWQYAGCGNPDLVPKKSVLGHSPSREELLGAGKRTQLRPLLYTFSSYLMRQHKTNEEIVNSKYWAIFEEELEWARGHEGNCGTGTWPLKCAASHRRHERQCQNTKRPPLSPDGCGTVMHKEWGEPGTPWRPGHCLMHAHRIVQKEFLRDLWRVSRL